MICARAMYMDLYTSRCRNTTAPFFPPLVFLGIVVWMEEAISQHEHHQILGLPL